MALLPVHTLWIKPAPEEFWASVLVQLWGVPTCRGARGGAGGGQCNYFHCWLPQQSFNVVAKDLVWNIYEILDKNMKNEWKSLFMAFQIFKYCFIKFTWRFCPMPMQSIMVLLNRTPLKRDQYSLQVRWKAPLRVHYLDSWNTHM